MYSSLRVPSPGELGVRSDNPPALDLPLGISRVALVTSLGNLVANVAQSADEGPGPRDAAGARCPRAPSQASPTRLLFRLSSRICEKVVDFYSSGHRSAASARMRSSRGLRAFRATTSTPTPKMSSRSWNKPM
jgi:hypothetical protein